MKNPDIAKIQDDINQLGEEMRRNWRQWTLKNLDVQMLETQDIAKYKKIEVNDVLRQTAKAVLIRYTYDHAEHWIPKSQFRISPRGELWVEEWFYTKELQP